jgi:hypothetical protein
MTTLFYLLHYTNHTYFLCMIYVRHYNSLKKLQKHALRKTWRHVKYETQKWLNKISLNMLLYNLLANTRHYSMTQNITTRPFMHGWTIRHVTLFCNIDNWWNEFIMLGTKYWYWKNCKIFTYIIKLERLPNKMCHLISPIDNFMQHLLLLAHLHLLGIIKG